MERKTKDKCLVPGCKNPDKGGRGLCPGHYNVAGTYVKQGLVTWEQLEKKGKARPAKGRWGTTGETRKFFLS